MRSPELITQTTDSPESHRHSIGETPLFEQLKLEYLKNQGDSDIEPVVSKNGAAISMLLEGMGSETARNTYKAVWETLPDDVTEAGMQVYLEQSYKEARKEDPEFLRPAAIYTADNKTYWNASTQQGTTGIALVSDKSSMRLGSRETAGTIEGPLLDGHKLVIADNTLLDQLDQNDALNLKAIEHLDDNGERELYPFYSAVVMDNDSLYARDKAPKHRMDNGQREALARTIADRKIRARTDLGLSPDATDDEVKQERKARKNANRQVKSVTTGDLAVSESADSVDATTSLGISEMFQLEMKKAEADEKRQRLTDRVEKYTQKVASYEDIAAHALAKRMKGRLFKPLTRKGKENAKTDDLNMHLLEGFSRALDGAMMKQWLAEGYSDDEAAQMLYEHQQTRQEARAARNREEFRKDKLGSFLDKYANMSKGKKIGVTIGAAAAFGTIGLVAGAAGGAAAVVGGIGLAGVKVGKTYLQHRSKIYETGKDESMTPPDRPVSVVNGQAAKRTAAQQVFAGMEHDEKKREKAIQKSDRNKKVAAGLAAAAGILIGAGVATKIAEHGDNIRDFFDKPLDSKVPTEVDGPDTDRVAEPPVTTPEPITPQPEFSADATTVTSGEGWYQTIQETTGVTDPARQAAILQKIGPALQEKGWAYPMSDGTWGISRPGALPRDVLELIKNSQ